MKLSLFLTFLITASLVSASSTPIFQAFCDSSGCGGSYDGILGFATPFPDGPAYDIQVPQYVYQPFMDFGIGTSGGTYMSGGYTCDYDVVLGGTNCDGEIDFGAPIGAPDPTGHSLGDVVYTSATGFARGGFAGTQIARPSDRFHRYSTCPYSRRINSR